MRVALVKEGVIERLAAFDDGDLPDIFDGLDVFPLHADDLARARVGMEIRDGRVVAPVAAPDLDELRQEAIKRVRIFASQARAQLAGTDDPAKFAIYNQRASFARHIKAGTASPAMFDVAKSEAVRIGLATDIEGADAATMADIWIKKDERLAKLAAELDATETAIIAAINAADTINAIDEAVASALSAAQTRIKAGLAG